MKTNVEIRITLPGELHDELTHMQDIRKVLKDKKPSLASLILEFCQFYVNNRECIMIAKRVLSEEKPGPEEFLQGDAADLKTRLDTYKAAIERRLEVKEYDLKMEKEKVQERAEELKERYNKIVTLKEQNLAILEKIMQRYQDRIEIEHLRKRESELQKELDVRKDLQDGIRSLSRDLHRAQLTMGMIERNTQGGIFKEYIVPLLPLAAVVALELIHRARDKKQQGNLSSVEETILTAYDNMTPEGRARLTELLNNLASGNGIPAGQQPPG